MLSDLDAFLQDHAACEKKASAMAMSLVAHYPDRLELVREMIVVAQEELLHFAQVYALMESRGIKLAQDAQDPYVAALLKHVRSGRDDYFLDRLLMGAVIEARGCERFRLIAESVSDETMRDFYQKLWRSEAKHAGLFLSLSYTYHNAKDVDTRLNALLSIEAEVLAACTIRPALH